MSDARYRTRGRNKSSTFEANMSGDGQSTENLQRSVKGV